MIDDSTSTPDYKSVPVHKIAYSAVNLIKLVQV